MNSQLIAKAISDLKQVAKKNGFDIIFRNHRTACGDFCIFVYKKSVSSSYLVGYDGTWTSDISSACHFNNCVKSAAKFINEYK